VQVKRFSAGKRIFPTPFEGECYGFCDVYGSTFFCAHGVEVYHVAMSVSVKKCTLPQKNAKRFKMSVGSGG